MRKRFQGGFLLFFMLNLIIFMTLRPALAIFDEPLPLYARFNQISGPLQLDVVFDPPIIGAADSLVATLTLTNQTPDAAAPTIDILIPATVTLDTSQLPIGLSLNAQANHLIWLPVLTGQGDKEQITLHLKATFADIQHPEQNLVITLQSESSSQTLNAPFWLGVPPQVSLPQPAQVAVGQPVALQAVTSGPGPFSQTWDLGDGRTVHAQNPNVVYSLAGTYQVTVQVANPLAAAAATTTVHVVAEPSAQFSTDDTTPGVNQNIQFINASGGAGPLAFTWDFGDNITSTAIAPIHAYNQPGTYLVHLQAENTFGLAETSFSLTVGSPHVADFVINETATTGSPVTAQAFTDSTASLVTWDMGDGYTTQGLTISHTYATSGNYWVVMSAQNDFGTTQIGRWVAVTAGPSTLYLPLLSTANLTSTLYFSPTDTALITTDILPDEVAIITQEAPPSDIGITPAEQLLWYINEARRLHNLPPLTYNYELTVAAQRHSDDMGRYGYTGHTGSDGTRPEQRQQDAGYQGTYAGEVTYWGYDQVSAVVEFWVNSPAHRNLILSTLPTDVGVSYTYNPYAPSVWYWVAEFGLTQPVIPPTTTMRLKLEPQHADLPRHLERLIGQS